MEVGTSSQFARPQALAATPPKDGYAALEAVLEDAIYFSGKRAYWFGILYYGSRFVLITLSACAAAKGISFLVQSAAVLSLLVAIGTTVDTWLQPSVKYKGHYTYNDKFRALKSDLYQTEREDKSAVKALNEQWKALDEDYRKTVLPL
jgi:hypothetical protein